MEVTYVRGLDALGLIINSLREHERRLDEGVSEEAPIPVFEPKGMLKDRFLMKYAASKKAAWGAYRYRGVGEGVYGAMERRFGYNPRSLYLKN